MADQAEFTRRYQGLLDHYGLVGEKTQPNHGNENGDIEQRHHRFKRALDQALMLRGSRIDFADREAYAQFLRRLVDQLNAGRRPERLAEELQGGTASAFPRARLEAYMPSSGKREWMRAV